MSGCFELSALWCWKYIMDFPPLFHPISRGWRRKFSPLQLFGTFPLPKFIYIFVVIQILRNLFTFHGPELPPRPLSIKRRRERADTRPSRIISQLNESDDLHSSCSSLHSNNYIWKISICECGGREKGSVNIAQDSVSVSYKFPLSIPD